MTHLDSAGARTLGEPAWAEAGVAVALDDGNYLLDDGRMARQALSCLVQPQQGDRALVAACRQGENYIVHLLARAAAAPALLGVPGAGAVTWRQARIALCASERLALQSLRDAELSAATGTLALNARNLFAGVTDSLVQNARDMVVNAEHYLLQAGRLLRLHGRQASITADSDVKVDAERISLG